jgi:hypothetical protein
MTTRLPISFHPHATDEDIVEAIASYMRDARAAAVPGAFRIVVDRLREAYGRKLVDRALRQYEKALGRERRRLKQQNTHLEKQVRQARAAGMKRS